uniref:Si:ch73-379j16.2 n=1 Tax=Seriola dumerili TaxID=41447 RepID=A0A3B4U5S6_SERDU
MGAGGQRRGIHYWWVAFRFSVLLSCMERGSAQIKYSVPEEVKIGSVVGNVAKDLGLDISSLEDRRFRIVSGTEDAQFDVNRNNGVLYVHKNIDREELCESTSPFLQKSLDREKHHEHRLILTAVDGGNPPRSGTLNVTVIVLDSNDNHPTFSQEVYSVTIPENVDAEISVIMVKATDLDEGVNGDIEYFLGGQIDRKIYDMFVLDKDTGEIRVKGQIDFEKVDVYKLNVHATDKGQPPMSTLNVSIIVLDSNDNRPIFSQDVYQIEIQENVAVGTSVFQINATDPDEGTNGEIEYILGKTLKKKVYDIFELDTLTGEIRVKGVVDYEENDVYKLDIEASDKGTPPLTGECRVIVKIKDVNDNLPEIEVTSLSNTVSEDSKPGTVISLLSVTDKDSSLNGKIILSITSEVPFELKPSYKENTYSVVTKRFLDREEVSQYEITIKATDCGEPPLATFKTLSVQISDVNDNTPKFSQNPLQFYISENNVAGKSIFSVSATDRDLGDNAAISYYIMREGNQNDMTSFLNINPSNGHITEQKSFDFETMKTFQFHIVASDSGTPSLSSNVTVNVFILDQNDNAPVILYPEIPRNVNAGHLVTKVRAYDADIGYNGWLLFSLQEVTDHSLFGLDRYTGQIRTLRSFTETDEAEHKLVILVKDNGNISLSATATVIVKLVEPKEAFAASDVKSSAKADEDNNVTLYLMITLGSVSALFLISIIVLIAMQCSKSTDYTSKYLQETNYDGTLCHSIQYRSGDKRYMLVGPRMSIGSTIVPGSHANTLVLPDRRRTSEEVRA